MTIDKQKLNELSNDMNKLANEAQIKHNYELTKSREATAFLLGNIDQLKYILATHKLKNRYDRVIEYMDNNFEYYDQKIIDKILFRNGIFNRRILFYFSFLFPLSVTFLLNAIMILLLVKFIFLFFMNLIIILPFMGFLCHYTDKLIDSKFINYRLRAEHKRLGIPVKKIPLRKV